MVYYGRTTNEHVDLTLSLVVEGIPYAFVERDVPAGATGLGGRTQVVCITRAEEGEAALSYEERRETAATLDVELLDTDDDLFRTLFAAGARPVAWVTTADANEAADTTIYTNTDAPFSVGQHVYIQSETVTIGTVDPSPYIIVTRGAFGSTALNGITGENSDGDSIYTVPPFWRGRRAWLYGYTGTAASETLLGVYIVDEAPRHAGDRRWALRLAGVVQEYFERSVGMGLKDITTTGATGTWTNGTPSTYEIPVTLASAFRLSPSGWPTYAMVTNPNAFGSDGGRTVIVELLDVDTVGGTITLAVDGSFGTRGLQAVDAVGPPVGWAIRQIGVIQSPGASSILVALLSDEGQALSGGDYLPGRPAATSSDYGWRLGAGFKSTEIDSTAFDEIAAVPPMTIVIDGERKVTDLLREWCILTGTAIVSTVDGKLKPITLAAQRADTARTLGADDVVPEGPVEVEHDESGIYPLVTIRAGYSPITGELNDEINLIDVELAKRYRRTPQRREIEIRSLDVRTPGPPQAGTAGWRHPSRVSVADMVTMINDSMRGDGSLARRFVRLSLTHEHLDLRIGDVVTIGTDLPDAYDGLPDMRGSTIAGATARVVARRPRYDQARVDVRLELMDRLLHVCPAAVIASSTVVGGGTEVTLATTGPEVSDTTPTDDFYAGAGLLVVDRSTPANTEAVTVVSISSGTVMVIDTPSFAIQNNVDYVVLDPEGSADGTTGSGYTLIEFAKLAGDDGVAGVNVDTTTEPRWR
jgi:hypothetical protein